MNLLNRVVKGVILASLLLTLFGCVSSGSKVPEGKVIPPLPSNLLTCFDSTVAPPPSRGLTKSDVVKLISALKKSETEKALCGKQLLDFYGDLERDL